MARFRISAILVAVALALPAGSAPAWAGEPPVVRASRVYERGQAFFVRGNHARAEKEFRRALDILPGFPEAHIGLGHLHMLSEEFEDALEEYYLAYESWGTSQEAINELKVWQYDRAQRKILELQDGIQNLRSQMTRLDRRSQSRAERQIIEMETEITRLRGMEALDRSMPKEPPPHLDLYVGNALFELKRFVEAVDHWKACVRKDPRIKMAYHNLALGLGQLGEFGEALEILREAEQQGFPVSKDLRAELERLQRTRAPRSDEPPKDS